VRVYSERVLTGKENQAMKISHKLTLGLLALAAMTAAGPPASAQAQQKRPNIVMLMTDDTGWNDFGAYSNGGKALGHPTPNVDQIAEEGATFTNWYGQASCTAGRASFITGRIPIRSALSIVVAPADPNFLRKETPTIAEFFKKNGYSTYFSGKWHLGDKPESYPIEHGFDEMPPPSQWRPSWRLRSAPCAGWVGKSSPGIGAGLTGLCKRPPSIQGTMVACPRRPPHPTSKKLI
jgi:Sulfatase